jgi:hypothetical protein
MPVHRLLPGLVAAGGGGGAYGRVVPTQCFWTEPAGDQAVGLRRFRGREKGECPGRMGYHHAVVMVGRAPERVDERGYGVVIPAREYRGDPRWPTACEDCGEPFRFDDHWQVWTERIWRAADGREWTDRELPPGAMFDGWWYPWKGPDGIALVVVLPPPATADSRGHWWVVDGPATGPDGERKPGAWTRTGDPRAVPPTVSATPSILSSDYHGFLTNGVLEP